jgi:hypothetical protein
MQEFNMSALQVLQASLPRVRHTQAVDKTAITASWLLLTLELHDHVFTSERPRVSTVVRLLLSSVKSGLPCVVGIQSRLGLGAVRALQDRSKVV